MSGINAVEIVDKLQIFKYKFDRNGKDVALLCHTSMVNYDFNIIKRIEELEYEWIYPYDVQWAWYYLCYSRDKNIAEKARYLLEKAIASNSPEFAFNELYEVDGEYGCEIDDVFDGIIVALFCDPAATEEFIECMPAYDNVYVANVHPQSAIQFSMPVALTQNISNPIREIDIVHYEDNFEPKTPLHPHKLSRVYTYPEDEKYQYMKGTSFVPVGKCGGESVIYKSGHFGDEKLIKYYTKKLPSIDEEYKLKQLQNFNRKSPLSEFLALPEFLLLDEPVNYWDHAVLGFTMRDFSRDSIVTLQKFIDGGCTEEQRYKVMTNILMRMQELQMHQIYPTDPSIYNIMIDKNTLEVYLIDCDSFEAYNVPSATYREGFLHPELDNLGDDLSIVLRQLYHHNFAIVCLLFYCMCGWNTPLRQKLTEDEYKLTEEKGRRWSDFKFAFDVNCAKDESRHNDEIYEDWNSLPYELQVFFADEFHFRRTHSLGEWLGLIHGILENLK